MKLHYRLWIVFSLIWLGGLTLLYGLLVNIYSDRAIENQQEVAFSQGYTITSRISGLIPRFSDRAEGYLDYYSELFELRLLLLSADQRLTYDSFKELSPGDRLKLSILDKQSLPATEFIATESFGYVQYTLLPLNDVESDGYLVMIKDANTVAQDIGKFRTQVLVSLGLATFAGFVIFYGVASWFTRPIRRMMWHLQQISPQNREFPMRYRRKDEIGQLIKEIRQMVQQVHEYEQRQRRFISTSSHELKTPLSTMQLILENLPSLRSDKEMHDEYIADLQLQIDKMRTTVQGMLDVYRLADKPLQRRRLSFTDIRQHVEQQFQHAAERKKIRLLYQSSVDSLRVDVDLFKRGLDNLVSNAIRYSPEHTEVRIELFPVDDKRIRFSVCDQGIGISSEELSYVFEPFYRANEATRWSLEGSGLGLAIVKQMVELHEGEIEMESELGKGTCVHLLFSR